MNDNAVEHPKPCPSLVAEICGSTCKLLTLMASCGEGNQKITKVGMHTLLPMASSVGTFSDRSSHRPQNYRKLNIQVHCNMVTRLQVTVFIMTLGGE